MSLFTTCTFSLSWNGNLDNLVFSFLLLCRNVKQFKKKCSAFFIDLVSTVCFKDNSPPCTAIIHHLLSFLTVEAQSSPIIRGTLLPSDGLSQEKTTPKFYVFSDLKEWDKCKQYGKSSTNSIRSSNPEGQWGFVFGQAIVSLRCSQI